MSRPSGLALEHARTGAGPVERLELHHELERIRIIALGHPQRGMLSAFLAAINFLNGVAIGPPAMWAYSSGKLQRLSGTAQEAFTNTNARTKQGGPDSDDIVDSSDVDRLSRFSAWRAAVLKSGSRGTDRAPRLGCHLRSLPDSDRVRRADAGHACAGPRHHPLPALRATRGVLLTAPPPPSACSR